MRVKDKGTRWSPNPAPFNVEDLPIYLFTELTNLGRALFQIEALHMDRQFKLPEKPRDGDLALFADDVILPEGGLYYYNGEDWVFIA